MYISRFCNDITSEEYKIAQLGAYACQNFLIYMSNNIKLFCQETNFKSKKKKILLLYNSVWFVTIYAGQYYN